MKDKYNIQLDVEEMRLVYHSVVDCFHDEMADLKFCETECLECGKNAPWDERNRLHHRIDVYKNIMEQIEKVNGIL